eukprot:660245-Hanusia_phi.AAC.2
MLCFLKCRSSPSPLGSTYRPVVQSPCYTCPNTTRTSGHYPASNSIGEGRKRGGEWSRGEE